MKRWIVSVVIFNLGITGGISVYAGPLDWLRENIIGNPIPLATGNAEREQLNPLDQDDLEEREPSDRREYETDTPQISQPALPAPAVAHPYDGPGSTPSPQPLERFYAPTIVKTELTPAEINKVKQSLANHRLTLRDKSPVRSAPRDPGFEYDYLKFSLNNNNNDRVANKLRDSLTAALQSGWEVDLIDSGLYRPSFGIGDPEPIIEYRLKRPLHHEPH